MRIKRFKIKNSQEGYAEIQNSGLLRKESERIAMEKPSEIVVFYDGKDSEKADCSGKDGIKAENIKACMYFWHGRPDYENRKTSYIGNIEVYEKEKNQEELSLVFKEIFDALKNEGVETVIGPLNRTTWNKYRYVVEKGEKKPFLMEPWNEDYYVSLIRKIGFEPFAYYISTIMKNFEKKENLDRRIEKTRRLGYYDKVRTESAENYDLEEVLNKAYDITVKAFKNNLLYSELEREVFMKMYFQYGDRLLKNFFKFAYFEDRLAGFAFAIPDYYELQENGRIETVILKTLAVLPEYNGKGIGYILTDEIVKEAQKCGLKNVIYALMYEGNVSKNLGLLLGEKFRRYALFKKEL